MESYINKYIIFLFNVMIFNLFKSENKLVENVIFVDFKIMYVKNLILCCINK